MSNPQTPRPWIVHTLWLGVTTFALACGSGGGGGGGIVEPTDGTVNIQVNFAASSGASVYLDSLIRSADQARVHVTAGSQALLDSVLPYTSSGGPLRVRLAVNGGTRSFEVQVQLLSTGRVIMEANGSGSVGANQTTTLQLNAVPVLPLIISSMGDTTAIQGLTSISFTAGGDNPQWQSFAWDFGDGRQASGQAVSHVYTLPGHYRVTLRAVTATGEATVYREVAVGTLSGLWIRDAVQGVRHRLEVIQNGETITGRWWVLFDPGSPFGSPADSSSSALSGTVVSHSQLRFAQGAECKRSIVAGTVSPQISVIGGSGEYLNTDCGTGGTWRFRRADYPGPVASRTLP
jgi:hypothetical protein